MKSMHNIFVSIVFLNLTIISCGNVQDEFDASISTENVEKIAMLVEKLEAENIRYSLKGEELRYFSEDNDKFTRLYLNVQDELYPIYNSLAIDDKELIENVSELLGVNEIHHKVRIKISDFSHDKRVRSDNGKVTFYYLVLDKPTDACKANSLIESEIGPFSMKTKEFCN